MDNAAVSIQDIIRRKQLIKWSDYQYLKYIVKQAYNNPDLFFIEEVINRPSFMRDTYIRTKHLAISSYFNRSNDMYVVKCQII
ncbi:hypothetical protein P4a_00076 [Klebsiella phage VLCpiP4a]|nr:hypothetical protein P4a_00076 [Klebsiella phage VLCpiP4a]